MVHIPGLSRPFKSAPKATARPPSPTPTSNPPLEDPTTGSVLLRNPASDQLEGCKGSNSSPIPGPDSREGNPEEGLKQADGDIRSRFDDEGDEAEKSIRLEPKVEIAPGGSEMIPSSAAPSSTLATIPNPRKSGSSDRSTTSSKSGSENRKGRTGGITGSPRGPTCETDQKSTSVKDRPKEVDEGLEKVNETKKDEKGQGREKERSTVVVGKRDRKRSTDTSSSSSSMKAGSGSGGGFVRDVVEDENKVSSSYRYVGSESRESDFTFFDLFLLIYRHPNRTAGSLPFSHPPILFAPLIRLLSPNRIRI
jgi:hypothetical protein